jgi:glycerol kinase
VHLWHRRLPAGQHGVEARGFPKRPADHRGLDGPGSHPLRPGGERLHRRAAVQWIRDGLGFIGQASEIESLAASVPDSGGVVFVPALAGLGAPHWRPEARGVIWGSPGGPPGPTSPGRPWRGRLPGHRTAGGDVVGRRGAHRGTPGGRRGERQRPADAVPGGPRPGSVVRPRNVDTTALGAGMLAGLGVGLWTLGDLSRLAASDRASCRG